MLSEIREKDKYYYDFTYIWNRKRKKKSSQIQRTDRWLGGGEVRGEVKRYKFPVIK